VGRQIAPQVDDGGLEVGAEVGWVLPPLPGGPVVPPPPAVGLPVSDPDPALPLVNLVNAFQAGLGAPFSVNSPV